VNAPLPAFNAAMNAACCACLLLGLVLIKRGRRTAHARVMVAATVFGAAFLGGYVYYHFVVQPELGPTTLNRDGWIKRAYLALLLSHVVLAAANVPLVLVTLWRAYRADWERHKRIAKVTWPVWFYVSVTGILVYFALYHWNPPAPG
jgi:uncharacterized membrane protein YozB (DUF420 family)